MFIIVKCLNIIIVVRVEKRISKAEGKGMQCSKEEKHVHLPWSG